MNRFHSITAFPLRTILTVFPYSDEPSPRTRPHSWTDRPTDRPGDRGTGIARGITPEPSPAVLFRPERRRRCRLRKISAAAAAAAAVPSVLRAAERGRTDGGLRGRRRRSFDVRPSVRPSKIALFFFFFLRSPLRLFLRLSPASLPSLIVPVIRSHIPERASTFGLSH